MGRFIKIITLFVCINGFSAQKTHAELVTFFKDWRRFATPTMTDGVPNYSPDAMKRQHAQLKTWQKKLAAFDTSGWSIPNQVDWYIIWAEMNGLDFKHRVKRPWATSPKFYIWFYSYPTDVPERESPNIHGNIELHRYPDPLDQKSADEITTRLNAVPELLKQARKNLTGGGSDMWNTGIGSLMFHTDDLKRHADKYKSRFPALSTALMRAFTEYSKFIEWCRLKAPKKTGKSGVGKENYTWNLRNVHLLPTDWDDQVTLMKRELWRSHTSLRLEEHRNRKLPKLKKIDNAKDYTKRFNKGVDEFIEFLQTSEVVTMKPYMDKALRDKIGSFTPNDGIRGFFSEIDYREPVVMRTHFYHWIELARLREEPYDNPIRQIPMMFNAFDSRAEGLATGMEEMMMHAGLLADKPRARELIWILLAQRAARGLGGLYQHADMMTHQQACDFSSKWTPWGLLPADGGTIQGEQAFYLSQPSYGTSYIIGKILTERLIAEYARQRNGKFVLKEFIDELNATGVIPISLVYWQMTGDKSMLNEAIGGDSIRD